MIPGSANPLLLAAAAPTADGGDRSLRFNSSDSGFLSRTPSVAGNRKTWTWAGWVKRSGFASTETLFSAGTNGASKLWDGLRFDTNSIRVFFGGAVQANLVTSAVFRDPAAWLHIVLAVDTSVVSPSSDRIKLYVNGIRVDVFTSETYPAQDYLTNTNNSLLHYVGGETYNPSGKYFNGYLADIHFIDGQALDPTSFGEFDDNGVWQPIEYTGSYGTNGFHLPFSDNSTAAALGTDTSGNSNTWTVNNISVAAGSGNDSLVDTPTNAGTDTGVGGEVRGNYATLNPLFQAGTYSNGNLDLTTTSGNKHYRGTIGVSSGKWYWEFSPVSGATPGIVALVNDSAPATENANQTGGYAYYGVTGYKQTSGVDTPYGATYTYGDIIGVAFDADNGTLVFYKNGVSQGTAFTGLTSGPYYPACSAGSSTNTTNFVFNAGQRPFAYTAPSGFKALCTTNLPDPVVAKPSEVMDVKLYTGNGTSQTISGLGFSPDLVWVKDRSAANYHTLQDIVRGATKDLYSNVTDAEGTQAQSINAFNSDGFSVGTAGWVNASSNSYVAWTWDAGSSTVSNTDGSITSQVRANPSAGFSIATFTNVSGTQSVGHGLGVPPHMVILRYRDRTSDWAVYHKTLGPNYYVNLNTTAAAVGPVSIWGNGPTSSVVELTGFGQNGFGQIMYSFAPVDGYSSFGSYTGNGNFSGDGPFVGLPFAPAFLLIKNTNTSSNWLIFDNKRPGYNLNTGVLYANLSDVEGSSLRVLDLLSNGFKIKPTSSTTSSQNDINKSGDTYIYAAFAENPFKTARAR